MNWLLRLLGYRGREYRGSGFSVRIDPVFREAVSVIYTARDNTLNLSGERVGKRWEGVDVLLPDNLENTQVTQIVHDLEVAFAALRYEYVISRKIGVEVVPEPERQAALAELHEMGYEIEILSDGAIRQTRTPGAPRPSIELARAQAPRMMSLIQSVRGSRVRIETLAKSSAL
jgi:hypothetical protein